MDYEDMLEVRIAREASLTVGAIEVPISESRRFGVLDANEERHITGFQEMPESAASGPWNPGYCLGSMGIYIFDTDVLMSVRRRDAFDESSSPDFGNDIIPKLVAEEAGVYVYLF